MRLGGSTHRLQAQAGQALSQGGSEAGGVDAVAASCHIRLLDLAGRQQTLEQVLCHEASLGRDEQHMALDEGRGAHSP